MGTPRTTPRIIKARINEQKALQMRIEGKTLAEIAQALGYSNQSVVWHAIVRALERLPRENAEQLRNLSQERLEATIGAHWRAMMRGKAAATDRIHRAIELEMRLHGLDKQNVTHDIGDTIAELIRRLAEDTERDALRPGEVRAGVAELESAPETDGVSDDAPGESTGTDHGSSVGQK
jgi:AraC-like DNA-binding protein